LPVRRRSQGIIDAALDAIIVIDRDNRITEFNPAACRIFGWTRAQAVGRDAGLVIPEELRERHRAGLARNLATGESRVLDRRLELEAVRADGSRFPIELSVSRLGGDEQPSYTAFVRDITERRQMEDRLVQQAARLDAVVRAQHELARMACAPEQLFDRIAGLAQQALAADGAAFVLPDGEDMVFRAASGVAVASLGLRLPMHGSLSGQALREQATLLCEDALDDPRVDPDCCHSMALRSIIVSVLHSPQGPVGVITVMAREANRFSSSDANALDLFVAGLGAVLARSREQAAQDQATRIRGSVQAVQQQLTTFTGSVDELMSLIAEQAQQLTGATGAVVEMIDGADMLYRAGSGSLRTRIGMRIGRDGSLSGLCAADGRIATSADTERDPRVNAAACREVGARSMVVAPLRGQHQMLGVLKVISDQPAAFVDADLHAMQILVETLGLVIQRRQAAEATAASEEKYRMLFRDHPYPMWTFDADSLAFLEVNRAAVRQYGYSEQEFAGMSILDIRPEADRATLRQRLATGFGPSPVTMTVLHRKKSGELIDVELTSDHISVKGAPARLVLAHDVSARLRAQRGQNSAARALRMVSACNEMVIRASDEPALLADSCRVIVDTGGYAYAGIGYLSADNEDGVALQAGFGHHARDMAKLRISVDPASPFGQGPGAQALRSGQAVFVGDLVRDYPGLPWAPAAVAFGLRGVIALPLQVAGATIGFLGLFSSHAGEVPQAERELLNELAANLSHGIAALRGKAERERIRAELDFAAIHDTVTGLLRYAAAEGAVNERIRAEPAGVALILAGVERFSAVNEALNHDDADRVLAEIGRRVRDFAEAATQVVHLAGDEFVLVASAGRPGGVPALAEALRARIAEPVDVAGVRLMLTATIGVSCSPDHGSSAAELLRRAQAAVENGKAGGRDCVVQFSRQDMALFDDRVSLGARLRQAIDRNEMQLHYQPQFRANTLALAGFEALLRWTSAELGPVSPGRFVPVAEGLGMMTEIGAWVIREACRQCRLWLDQGFSGFTVAVNVSALQLRRPGLAATVAAALAEFALPAGMLEVEITESALMENVGKAQGILAELRAMGVRLALDDFGTGYSSLAYLKHFPLGKLKIDQAFVRGLPHDDNDAAIARTIVSIGHRFGLVVSAEGVETTEQADFLRGIECDELQGYLLGRPVDADAARALISAAKRRG
jgi:PAS domain S-box-containing protein/diguanylate cyclase (GGDEF)-like protein